MAQSFFNVRHIPAHHKRQRQYMLLWNVIVVFCMWQNTCDGAQSISNTSSTQTILAHPSMFGSPWTGVVTAVVLKTTINLCNDTLEPTEDSFFFQWSNELNDQYETAVFYDDPYAEGLEGSCDYSQMAQNTERLYPSAKYLLVSKDTLSAMGKMEDEPDTNLSLASIQLEDAKAMNNMFRNETGAFVSNGVILFTIDAYSRAYVDTCNCSNDQADVERKRLWETALRVGGGLSILGSIYVIFSLIGTSERRKKSLHLLFNRLLITICLFDIIGSLGFFWNRWAAPSSPPGDFEKFYSQAKWDIDNPDAYGNDTTCTVAGIMIQMGMSGSTLFTAFLAAQTLLVVKYSWKEKEMRKVEIFFFSFGISFVVITSSILASLSMMNVAEIGICWIAPSVRPCLSTSLGPLFDGYCEENLNFSREQLPLMIVGFAMGWVCLALLFAIYAMFSLFFFVRHQERRASRWTLTSQAGRQQKLVFARSMMYITVYALIWAPGAVSIALGTTASMTVAAVLVPLQGFLNAIIYTGVFEKYCMPRPTRDVAASTTAQFTNSIDAGSVRHTQGRSSRFSNLFSSRSSGGDMENIPNAQSRASQGTNTSDSFRG